MMSVMLDPTSAALTHNGFVGLLEKRRVMERDASRLPCRTHVLSSLRGKKEKLGSRRGPSRDSSSSARKHRRVAESDEEEAEDDDD